MKTKTVYLLFSSTGTLLARTIDFYTKQSLNHVSISLDQSLSQVYSFGRKWAHNPFIGGFIKENFNLPLFTQTNCMIYELKVTEQEYNQLTEKILLMESQKHLYRYNFLGLLGVIINKEFQRKNAYFCSQFVASVLQKCNLYPSTKPAGLIRPQDLRAWPELKLLYQGEIIQYPYFNYRPEKDSIRSVRPMFSYYYFYMNRQLQRTKTRVLKSTRYFRF